jgi:hypothetical protein
LGDGDTGWREISRDTWGVFGYVSTGDAYGTDAKWNGIIRSEGTNYIVDFLQCGNFTIGRLAGPKQP